MRITAKKAEKAEKKLDSTLLRVLASLRSCAEAHWQLAAREDKIGLDSTFLVMLALWPLLALITKE